MPLVLPTQRCNRLRPGRNPYALLGLLRILLPKAKQMPYPTEIGLLHR